MDEHLSKSEREILKAVYRLATDGGAHTGTLAAVLNVSPQTVTAAVKRLAERDLLVHEPYHGVSLTARGRRSAVSAIRRHRIVERFLSDMLGYPWNEADRLAGTFEHDLPEEVGLTQPEVVEFLDTLGLRPGVQVEVREKHPFGGPVVLRVAGKDRTIGEKVATQIFVKKLDRKESA
jgi:Mn-dependent DtxR family transcriptional regulator